MSDDPYNKPNSRLTLEKTMGELALVFLSVAGAFVLSHSQAPQGSPVWNSVFQSLPDTGGLPHALAPILPSFRTCCGRCGTDGPWSHDFFVLLLLFNVWSFIRGFSGHIIAYALMVRIRKLLEIILARVTHFSVP